MDAITVRESFLRYRVFALSQKNISSQSMCYLQKEKITSQWRRLVDTMLISDQNGIFSNGRNQNKLPYILNKNTTAFLWYFCKKKSI